MVDGSSSRKLTSHHNISNHSPSTSNHSPLTSHLQSSTVHHQPYLSGFIFISRRLPASTIVFSVWRISSFVIDASVSLYVGLSHQPYFSRCSSCPFQYPFSSRLSANDFCNASLAFWKSSSRMPSLMILSISSLMIPLNSVSFSGSVSNAIFKYADGFGMTDDDCLTATQYVPPSLSLHDSK